MKKLVIFGIGLLGELILRHIQADSSQEVAAFCVDKEFVRGNRFCGLPLVSFDHLQKFYSPEQYDVLVAVGYAGLNRVRKEKIETCRASGYKTPDYISPHAIVLADIGTDGNRIVFEGAVVQRDAALGPGCLVWPGAVICHHTHCHGYAFIGPGAVVCGGASIGERALIGAGSVVRDFLSVGEGAIVGAGCRLLRDLPANAVCSDGESRITLDFADQISLWPPKAKR